MSLVAVLRVGRKGAIYLPRSLLERLGVREGDRVLVKLEDDRVVLEFAPDPFQLAVVSAKWSVTSVDEFEKESLTEQRRWTQSTS